MILGDGAVGLTTYKGACLLSMQTSYTFNCDTTWSEDGKTLSWYTLGTSPERQMNALGEVYQVVALMITR